MTTAVIHQPEYFPWLGFLDKARKADVFVFLDHVHFDRSSTQHRTRIAGSQGAFWLTLPFVHRFPQRIDEVQIADARWRRKHWGSLQASYGRASHWASAAERLETFYAKEHETLVEVAIGSVELLFDAFGVTPRRIVRSSALAVEGTKSDLVLDICRAVGATRYLAGRTGATYLDREAFAAARVAIEVQSYTPPSYARSSPLEAEDWRGLSALDAWAHAGPTNALFDEAPSEGAVAGSLP